MSSEINIVFPKIIDNQEIIDFSHEIKSPVFIADMLWKLGIKEKEDARDFFQCPLDKTHNGMLMKNMSKAVEIISEALNNKESILVHGDYDLDGISGTALLYSALNDLHANISTFLPSRFEHGYGLNSESVKEFANQGVKVILMVDTGVSAVEEVELAHKYGMKVVILDHHIPSDELPKADALVDPWLDGDEYPEKNLAGVGVGYKFIEALMNEKGVGDSKKYIDFLVLGTLADMVPLTGDNRRYVRHGMKSLGHSVFPGIKILAKEIESHYSLIRSQDISFRIVPLLNAPGRLGSAEVALKMLISTSDAEALSTLEELKSLNKERRRVEQKISKQALEMVEHSERLSKAKVLVLKSSSWHLGVMGIVASKVVNAYNKPVIIFNLGEDGSVNCSARGVKGFDWHLALLSVEDLLDRWGGHSMAAGCSFPKKNIDEVERRLAEHADAIDFDLAKASQIVADYELPISKINLGLMDWLHRFQPYGVGNSEPAFYDGNVGLNGRCKIVGGTHLQLDIAIDQFHFSAIAFGMGHLREKILESKKSFGIVYYPMWNVFRGRKSIQLQVVAFKL